MCRQTILKKLYSESLHVLSLSDLRYLRALVDQRPSDVGTVDAGVQPISSELGLLAAVNGDLAAARQSWAEEKQCLLASVESLKKLLAHIETHYHVSVKHHAVMMFPAVAGQLASKNPDVFFRGAEACGWSSCGLAIMQ